MNRNENEYQTEPMESSPPAYPPRAETSAEAGAAEGTMNADVGQDASNIDQTIADREVPRAVAGTPADVVTVEQTALFEHNELTNFDRRWSEIQTSFVDEPRRAVEQADALVSDVISRIGDSFGKQRVDLESQWDGGGQASTEDLRQIFQRYRSFFSRLLGI